MPLLYPAVHAGRTKHSITYHSRRLHAPSPPNDKTHRGRKFKHTHTRTPHQTKSLRRSRTRPTAERKAKSNRRHKKERRKKIVSAARPAGVGDTARASYVISDVTDANKQKQQQEAPLLSSPARPNDYSQTPRDYGNSDSRPGEVVSGEAVRPLNRAALKSLTSKHNGIIDSDTIVKDGQIFHRHDAREDRGEKSRGQSRRRHARRGDQLPIFDEAFQRDVGHRGIVDPISYFTAEALNRGGHSQTRVAGNMRGVDGSAVTLSRGKVTQAAVILGDNSSSKAQVTDHHGANDPILASTVGADQRSGSADARARAPDAATTHAQIEFTPTSHYQTELGEHGTASALSTPDGESTLATLGGQAKRGSYLGTAHSSTMQEPHSANHDQTQPSFENEGTQEQNAKNKSHVLMDMSDMVDSIIETVHQPYLPQEATHLPPDPHRTRPETKAVPAKEGLVGGNGDPPRESEIGRVAQQEYQEQERGGRQVAPQAAGQVDSATYYHGQRGAPPEGSDWNALAEGYRYDPSTYYNFDYPTDYRTTIDYDSPYLDLEPKVFHVQPLELDLNTLYPTPAPPPPLPHPHLDQTEGHSPAVVHHLQTTTPALPPHQPVATPDHSQTPDQPNIPDHSQTHIPDYSQASIPDYSHSPDYSQPNILDYSHSPDHSQPSIPDYSHSSDHSQPNIPDYSHSSDHSQPGVPDYSQPDIPDYSYSPDHSQPSIPDYSHSSDHSQPDIPDYSYSPDHSQPNHSQPSIPDYSQPDVPDYSHTPDHSQPDIPDYSHSPDHSQPNIPDYSHSPHHSQPSIPDSQTPNQPPTPHQSQIPDPSLPHLPNQSRGTGQSDTPPHATTPRFPYTSDPLPDHVIPDYSRTPDHIPDYPLTPYYPSSGQPLTPDHHTPSQSSVQSSFPSPQQHHGPASLPIPDYSPALPPHSDHRETNQPSIPRPSQSGVLEAAGGARDSMGSVQTMAMGVPLVPGEPGSSQILPNGEGGPILNVITMPVNPGMDTSVMQRRPGAVIQPGQNIPGAPGYKIPAGFRGYIKLRNVMPAEGNSRLQLEGFNAQMRLTPHSSASGMVFASVSGSQASQRLTSEGGVPGVHFTLSGGDRRQQYRAHGQHPSMRGDHRYATDHHQRGIGPAAGHTRPSHRGQPGAPLESGWQNGRDRASVSSTAGSWNRNPIRMQSNSWNDRHISRQNEDPCTYITIVCRVMVDNLGNRRQCRPSYNRHC
ncbi:Periaxin [Portunus trituberculatus]|uniref:Periaxin n=1 Tax=Portunus trituberculatus TaxID=210409 RepID=A0A5B7CRX2_PORTR|nr:Periaxin [Portunus trituberculatus]